MARKPRLSPDSTRDVGWAEQEYARLMGAEALERQQLEWKIEHDKCTCRRKTVKVSGGFLTLHREGCVKFKEWMADYAGRLEK
jgi:hypothetical protein